MAVVHDIEHHLFFIKLYEGAAKLKYKVIDKNVLDIMQTHIPEKNRGNGIASYLVKYAMDYAGGLT